MRGRLCIWTVIDSCSHSVFKDQRRETSEPLLEGRPTRGGPCSGDDPRPLPRLGGSGGEKWR